MATFLFLRGKGERRFSGKGVMVWRGSEKRIWKRSGSSCKMAFGKPNDCVKLALCEDVDIEKLDLSMLTEIKRSEKGTVEIKLLDRTKVLEQLAALADGGDDGAERFLQALVQGMEREDDG